MNDIENKVIAIQGVSVSSTPPTTGQFLRFNGTQWAPTTVVPADDWGLQFWLRADRGVTLSGSDVTAWADQSNIGDINRNMVSAVSHYPTYTSANSSYNNQATINFTVAGGQYMESVGNWMPNISAPYTIFIVGNDDGTSPNQTYYGDTATSPNGPFYILTILVHHYITKYKIVMVLLLYQQVILLLQIFYK